MKITIEGKEGRIRKLLKLNRLFLKRNKLSVSFEAKKAELKASEIVELIEKCEAIAELEKYSECTQKTVIKAFEAKKAELTETED